MNQYHFYEISVGQTVEFFFDIDEQKMEMFKVISGDNNPLHNDRDYAAECGYEERVQRLPFLHLRVFICRASTV